MLSTKRVAENASQTRFADPQRSPSCILSHTLTQKKFFCVHLTGQYGVTLKALAKEVGVPDPEVLARNDAWNPDPTF